jgi:acetaldehyde dehydrogenase (acetylating)
MVSSLTFEVADAFIRDEERTEGSVRIVSYEPSIALIELGAAAVGPFCFQDVFARLRIAQLLRHAQVPIDGDRAEFVAVFGEVFLEQVLSTKSPAAGPGKRGNKKEQNSGRTDPEGQPATIASR